ncbi:MAG TPA: YiiX/YebB-like N1pC/P60 family cysteine hydrolase, partial [Anaerolineae bacterium]
MIRFIARPLGTLIARYLNGCIHGYEPFAITDPHKLARVLQPADILLVEGDRRVSTAIKYLTQSTWSHAAIYIGDRVDSNKDPLTAKVLIEADLQEGVIAVPLGKYARLNTRVCRAVGLTPQTQRQVIDYVVARLGDRYDLKNVVDLARYLLPTPPVPVSWRRRMIALGSGDPTRAICSTLIAQAFQSIR